MKAFNGVGVVLAVLLAIALGIPKGKGAGVGFTETQHLFTYVIPLPALMILAYKRVSLDPSDRRIQITKGIWPFVVRTEIPFDDTVELHLDAMKGRWISYSVSISLPSQRKPVLILADGDEGQLWGILEFARSSGFGLHASERMQTLAPDWARTLVPELQSGTQKVALESRAGDESERQQGA